MLVIESTLSTLYHCGRYTATLNMPKPMVVGKERVYVVSKDVFVYWAGDMVTCVCGGGGGEEGLRISPSRATKCNM